MIEGPASGAWQMALDEALLEAAAEGGTAWLRFYRWSEPTLSLGYFQPYAGRHHHVASRQCPVVRRQTGGGAILHDRELTYCLVVPLAHPLAADTTGLYRAVHEALIEVLAEVGVCCELNAADADSARDEAFLCFARRARWDVLLRSAKVCGSAQRRRRGAVLQHGSLLLASSPQAPELPGIFELAGRRIEPAALAARWQQAMAPRLALQVEEGSAEEPVLRRAERLVREKYADEAWNRRR
jgi:lipoate-protein ligase A